MINGIGILFSRLTEKYRKDLSSFDERCHKWNLFRFSFALTKSFAKSCQRLQDFESADFSSILYEKDRERNMFWLFCTHTLTVPYENFRKCECNLNLFWLRGREWLKKQNIFFSLFLTQTQLEVLWKKVKRLIPSLSYLIKIDFRHHNKWYSVRSRKNFLQNKMSEFCAQ